MNDKMENGEWRMENYSQPSTLNSQFRRGFSVVEVMLAAGLFAIFSVGAVALTAQGLEANRTAQEQAIANQFAAEGIEAVRSIKNQSFNNLTDSAGTGVTISGGVWTFSGTNNVFDKYTRVISVSPVDTDTKKIVSSVSWNYSAARSSSIDLTTYLTNWRKAIMGLWNNPSLQSSVDLTGNGNGMKVFVSGNYAYVARTIGNPNFMIIDISNLATPSIAGSLNFTGAPTNVYVQGIYAYLSSGDNAGELQIVNVSNPTAPLVAGSFNVPGNADANAVYVSGSTAYLVRNNGTDPEFYILNVSNPAAVTVTGSLNLTGDIKAISVLGNFAYVASSSNSDEFQVINITNPASPGLTTTLNLSGNNDGLSIKGFGSTVVLGRAGGSVNIINVSTPATPSLLGTLAVGGDVNDISLGNSNNYAFLATTEAAADFRVVDITNPAAITSVGVLNMSATQNGVYYDATLDRAFMVGNANNPEFAVIQPN